MDEQPKRRRFRLAYGLRTLFVVMTVFAIWFGWQLQTVRERRAVRAQLAQGAGWMITLEEFQQIPSGSDFDLNVNNVPFWRVWLGDDPIAQIGFEKSVPQPERERVKKLFPEAFVSDQ